MHVATCTYRLNAAVTVFTQTRRRLLNFERLRCGVYSRRRLFEDGVYFEITFLKSFTTITVLLFKNIIENRNMFKLPEEGRLRYTGKILGLHNATAHWENSEEINAKYGHFELKKQRHTIK